MFWGLIMEPKRRYAQVVKRSFHISMAALDIFSADDEPNQVMLFFEERNYLLCTLQKGQIVQCALDLNFETGDEVVFATNGNSNIHLSGYIQEQFDEFLDEGEEEEEVEDEEEEEVEESKSNKSRKKKNLENHSKKQPPSKKSKLAELLHDEFASDDEDESYVLSDPADDDDEDDSDEEEDENDDEDENVEEEDEGMEEDKSDVSSLSEEEEEEVKKPVKQMNGDKKKSQKKKQEQNLLHQEPASKKKNKTETPKKQKAEQNQAAQKTPKGEQQKNAKSPKPGASPAQQKKTLEGGVIIQDLKVGDGNVAKPGRMVQVYYEGRLKQNNKLFDQSNKGAGFKFQLGKQEVIKGWDIGVAGMKIGGRRRIICPPAMAYGQKGSPPAIPPNSTLVFEVELKNIH